MKQIVLTLSILFISAFASAQDIKVYDIKGEGSIFPQWSISQSGKGIRIDLDLESISSKQETLNGVIAERIILEGGIGLMEKGQPDIQHIATSIAIPQVGKTVINPILAEYIDLPFFNIAPSKGDLGLTNNPESSIDTSIYNHNEFWPINTVTSENPYIIADVRGMSVHFYPVQYNPITQTLRVYHHISIIVEILNEKGINEVTRFSPVTSGIMQDLAADQFINAYDYLASSARYTAVEEQGKMLIICHPDFMNDIRALAEWKNQKGIQCEIADVSKIGDAAKIKEYVSEYYYSNGLTYLLLVGDDKFIPSNQATKGASDNMYGYISGDDHYPEILIGRFSCETAEQCRTMVERTINYEKNPSIKGRFDNFMGIGSSQGPGDDGELDYEHIRNIGAVTATVYKNFTELYDGSRGGNDLNGNPTAILATDAINSGQGTIMYLGHGSINSWLTTGFSTLNARELHNTETLPFIWSAGCNNGGFIGSTCLAEEFMRVVYNGKPAGAVAAFMSSANQTWYPPMVAQDEIALYLSGKKHTSGPLTFGGVSISGCMKMNDEYNRGAYVITDNWILFGDPSLELRTSKPTAYHPQHDTVIGVDALSLTISSVDSGSNVCVSSKGTILSAVRSEARNCTISLPELLGYDEITLTITGKNRIPYVASIKITNMPGIAVNPQPGNNTYKIKINQIFSWEFSQGCLPQSAMFNIKKAAEEEWTSILLTNINEIQLPLLDHMTAYEWKVISINNSGNSESAVYEFKTIDRPDEDFEQEGFPRSHWMNDHEWYIDNSEPFEGNYALHSGSTVNRGTSSLFYECETLGCDYISFMLKLNVQEQGTGIGFYIDNFLVAEWDYTMQWTNITYQVDPGKHLLEWRFTASGDSTNVYSAAWLDNIYLPVNNPLLIGPLVQKACPVFEIQLEASIENYASLKWGTSGTGYFDDPSRMDAIYYPSEEDLLQPSVSLDLTIASNSICADEKYIYNLIISGLTDNGIINDTTIYSGEHFNIPSHPEAVNQYIYIGNDDVASMPETATSKLTPGENIITVVYENELGCYQTKQFIVNYINTSRPSDNSLTVYPNPSRDQITINDPSVRVSDGVLSTVNIYNANGMLVEKLQSESLNGSTIRINHLNPGLYIIRSERNGNISTGRFIKI